MAEIRKNVKNIFKGALFIWSGCEQGKHDSGIGTLKGSGQVGSESHHVNLLTNEHPQLPNLQGPQHGSSPASFGIIGIGSLWTDYTTSQEMPCAKRLFPET